MKKENYTKETLVDIIEAQNEMISELLDKIESLENQIQRKHKPAVIENGVITQLERFVI